MGLSGARMHQQLVEVVLPPCRQWPRLAASRAPRPTLAPHQFDAAPGPSSPAHASIPPQCSSSTMADIDVSDRDRVDKRLAIARGALLQPLRGHGSARQPSPREIRKPSTHCRKVAVCSSAARAAMRSALRWVSGSIPWGRAAYAARWRGRGLQPGRGTRAEPMPMYRSRRSIWYRNSQALGDLTTLDPGGRGLQHQAAAVVELARPARTPLTKVALSRSHVRIARPPIFPPVPP